MGINIFSVSVTSTVRAFFTVVKHVFHYYIIIRIKYLCLKKMNKHNLAARIKLNYINQPLYSGKLELK